jgi:hypothetical protein
MLIIKYLHFDSIYGSKTLYLTVIVPQMLMNINKRGTYIQVKGKLNRQHSMTRKQRTTKI